MSASGRIMLASASTDDTIGVWTLDDARQRPHREQRTGWSNSVCAVLLDHQVVLACAGYRGTVRLWYPYTGKERRRIGLWRFRRCPHAHTSAVSALCTLESSGETRVASAGHDGAVRIWNLDTGQQLIVFNGHRGDVYAASAITVRGHRLIASGGDDQIILVWDPHTGRQVNALQGHDGRITGLCPILVNGRALLASTSHDGTARIWDPATGSLETTIPVHHEATGCVAAADRLIIGLTAGTLAISLNT
jgi:WD40 repeat protein